MLLEVHRVAPDRFSRPPVVSGSAEPLGLSGSAELTVEASGRRLTVEAPVEPL